MSVDFNDYTAQMITQMALVQASITTIGNLDEVNLTTLQIVYAALQNLQAPFDAAIAAVELDIDQTSVGSVVLGLPPPMMVNLLLNQATDVEQEARLVVGRAYVSRIGVNVSNSPG